MVESLKMQGPAKRLLSVEIPGELFLTLKGTVNDKFTHEVGVHKEVHGAWRCIDSIMYFLGEVTIWKTKY